MKTLKDALIGETVVVKKISGEPVLKRRLMDMGITKDCKIYIRKVAPLGDPVEITVRGYELSVRKEDASCVESWEIGENDEYKNCFSRKSELRKNYDVQRFDRK